MKFSWPFTDEQIEDPSNLTAVIATKVGHPGKKKLSAPEAAAYSISFAGGGREFVQWGAGYSRDQIPMIAHGVLRSFDQIGRGLRLVVHANRGLNDYIRPGGHARKPKAITKPTWKLFEPILSALDANHFTFVPFQTGSEPRGYRPALQILFDQALPVAQKRRWESHIENDFGITVTDAELALAE